MSEELYDSNDYCKLAEEFEELKKENAELARDKAYLINASMDGGDKYHYEAHDIGYRDLERKVKALEADCVISNRELLVKQVEITALRAELARRDEIIARLKEENHALDQINRDMRTASDHLDEVLDELARRDEIITRLKERINDNNNNFSV
jgi:DNA repair exonuclease SbcCD ATPase subunit